MPRVLVVDDEPRIVQFLSRGLSSGGFGVDTALDGAEGLALARQGRHDVVLLDLMLPIMDGVTVLQRLLAARPEQQVLVLSAVSDVSAKVRCLQLGASDFVQKPFSLAELIARIHARLREPRTVGAAQRVLVAGPVRLELLRRTVDTGAGAVALSEREFLLLQHLMRRTGEVCTREELLQEVWGFTFDPGTNVVNVCVGRLRAKLGSGYIETVRNVGYCLQVD
jgi:DNA-binding response OmpR family regulator